VHTSLQSYARHSIIKQAIKRFGLGPKISWPLIANRHAHDIPFLCTPLAAFPDIPLLYETKGESACDGVAVVSAPAITQRARVLARPGMSEEKLDAILKRQVRAARMLPCATWLSCVWATNAVTSSFAKSVYVCTTHVCSRTCTPACANPHTSQLC
jgi:dephospho-CoA kinase